ncbi:MAG TPA: hypothetical protein VIS74_08610, partial [Chthoniobacterales bacterium]
MIQFVLTQNHTYTLARVRKGSGMPAIGFIDYDALIGRSAIRRGTYIFGDFDRLGHWDLELAGTIYQKLAKEPGFTLLNNPARALQRFNLLRLLHARGLNGFNVHRAAECGPSMRFPVFLRKERGHGFPLSPLLNTLEDTEQAIEGALAQGIPLENLMLVEYLAEPIRPGLYRKWAVFRIGDRLLPHLCVHDTQWLVKYGKKGIADEDSYRGEREMLAAGSCIDETHLRKVFELAQIDYGRLDFGLVEGKIQVYEINT